MTYIRYSLAKSSDQIHDADRRFLKRAKTSSDSPFNTRQAAAIAAKYAVEARMGVKYPTQVSLEGNDDTDMTLVSKLQEMEQKGFGCDPASALKEKLMGHKRIVGKKHKKGRGLGLAGRGLRLAGRGPKMQRAKKYLKAGWEMARPHIQRYALETAKGVLQKRFGGQQSGGFVIALPLLIAAAVGAAKAIAVGGLGALGAWGTNKALKGRGLDDNIRNAIERVQLTINDFSPSAARKISMAQAMLSNNPQSINAVSKILQPIIKTSLAQKLQAWGITKSQAGGCMRGGSSEFTAVFKQNLGL